MITNDHEWPWMVINDHWWSWPRAMAAAMAEAMGNANLLFGTPPMCFWYKPTNEKVPYIYIYIYILPLGIDASFSPDATPNELAAPPCRSSRWRLVAFVPPRSSAADACAVMSDVGHPLRLRPACLLWYMPAMLHLTALQRLGLQCSPITNDPQREYIYIYIYIYI